MFFQIGDIVVLDGRAGVIATITSPARCVLKLADNTYIDCAAVGLSYFEDVLTGAITLTAPQYVSIIKQIGGKYVRQKGS